ncbi:MAG: HAD hydrolase family protein [Candidatus Cloacimonetes bacterium]|nr:HAD hydrolase family protein [Candidatus Cloacimonadota bacterium]HPN40365.1 HAD hydrolase family protein [Candidatus Cloacimonadota bacterium]
MAELNNKVILPHEYNQFAHQVTHFKKIGKPYKPRVNWDRINLIIFDCDGVLTDGKIIYGCNGEELKNFDAHDGMGFQLLRFSHVRTAVITGRSSAALERRCQDLKIDYLYQGVANKLEKTRELLKELKLDFCNLLYMGDDWNDIPVMNVAAVSVCPADAARDVAAMADYVMLASGGRGAVRECIELVLNNKTIYEQAVNDYLAKIS